MFKGYTPPQIPRAYEGWDDETKRVWSELVRVLENFFRTVRDSEVSGFLEERVSTYQNDVQVDTEAIVLLDTDAAGVDITVTLPEANLRRDKVFYIKNIGLGTFNVNVVPKGLQTIDGAASKTLSSLSSIKVVSDGSNWWII